MKEDKERMDLSKTVFKDKVCGEQKVKKREVIGEGQRRWVREASALGSPFLNVETIRLNVVKLVPPWERYHP